ncbi:MAG: NUDIX domain-containing protein [Pseudomonadota bacterium]
MADTPIRDAATVILLRDDDGGRQVLMGQRGAKAAFMPSKFVFPGGAVDPDDAMVPLAAGSPCAARLREDSVDDLSHALAAAAIRELWEETGLALGQAGVWRDAPPAWEGFAARGLLPDASTLRFVFRAITPPGRPRRFDARFFLAPVGAVAGDPDDFSAASDELSHLQWVPLEDARRLDLPFITEVVLAEIAAADPARAPRSVPFFRNDDEESLFLRLRGEDEKNDR